MCAHNNTYACAYSVLVICRNESFRIRGSLSHNSRDRTINDPTARRLQWPPDVTTGRHSAVCVMQYLSHSSCLLNSHAYGLTHINTSLLIRLFADPPRVRRTKRNVIVLWTTEMIVFTMRGCTQRIMHGGKFTHRPGCFVFFSFFLCNDFT